MPELLPNLRDVGGMPATGGAVVRHHMVLRSAMPQHDDLVPDGFTWPPRLVIDLRSPDESEFVHPLVEVSDRVINLPLLSALRPGAQPAQDLAGLYRVMLDYADQGLLDLVREVSKADGPTLIHCAAGKDRTGVSIALLLRLVGVERNAVVADYLATSDAFEAVAARLSRGPGNEHRETLPRQFFEVRLDAIESVLDFWDEQDGGTEGWLAAIGAESGLVDRLRSTLLA